MAYQSAPDGFSTSAGLLNRLKPEIVTELSDEVMQLLQFQIGAVKIDKWHQRLTDNKTSMESREIQSIVNSILYLYRTAAANKLTEDQLRDQLSACMIFSEPTLSALTSTWSSQGRSLIDLKTSEQLLDVGKLVDLKWKVGMAVSSDSCKNLNSPFVCLSLTVSDGSGNMKTHDLELTMDQFRNFTNQMKEIATMMETNFTNQMKEIATMMETV